MKKVFSILAGILLVSGLQAQIETRTFSNFQKINLAGGFHEVLLVAGDESRVEIDGKNGAPTGEVDIKESGDAINIAMRKGTAQKASNYRLKITYRQLSVLNSAGSSDVRTGNAIRGDKFVYNASSSGDLDAEFDVDVLECNFSGSGDMVARGKANRIQFAISGSSDINAAALQAQTGKVSISGSGDARVNVTGDLKSTVSGSGSIDNSH
ncbi:MAG: head GIN domain-containing protein [Saprospiraceae bacterium]|nr:head GIN domain-containing protein [Saprospiraceae bacterium]